MSMLRVLKEKKKKKTQVKLLEIKNIYIIFEMNNTLDGINRE